MPQVAIECWLTTGVMGTAPFGNDRVAGAGGRRRVGRNRPGAARAPEAVDGTGAWGHVWCERRDSRGCAWCGRRDAGSRVWHGRWSSGGRVERHQGQGCGRHGRARRHSCNVRRSTLWRRGASRTYRWRRSDRDDRNIKLIQKSRSVAVGIREVEKGKEVSSNMTWREMRTRLEERFKH